MTSARRARLGGLFATLVVTAVALVGCGGGGEPSRAEYERELRAAMDDLEAAYGQTGAVAAPEPGEQRSVGEVVSELRVAQVSLRDAGNRLDEIEPPEDLADVHRELVAGVRDMADAVDLLIEAQEEAAGDPQRARQLARQFATDESFERVEAAAARLDEAGVDAGL